MAESVDFRRLSIVVSGTKVELTFDDELCIVEISPEMDQVASQMAFWANVWAAAVEDEELVDAHYRAWRARRTEELAKTAGSEYKVKAAIEADPQFLKLKKAIAQTKRNVIAAKGLHDSFAKKANVLQSKGAMGRQEYAATGMHTPAEERPIPKRKPAENSDKKSAMRGVFAKK